MHVVSALLKLYSKHSEQRQKSSVADPSTGPRHDKVKSPLTDECSEERAGMLTRGSGTQPDEGGGGPQA